MLTPVALLFGLFVGLLGLLLPVVGVWLLYHATHPVERRVQTRRVDGKDKPPTREVPAETRVLAWHERMGDPAVWVPLLLGVLLVLLPFGGRHLMQYGWRAGDDEPKALAGEVHVLKRADGTTIHVEIFEPAGGGAAADAPTLVLTHGWGTDGAEWYYAKRQLAGRFRLIVWDLPGLGETAPWADQQLTLERMASDLHLVLTLANGRPVVLVGHSIGGMINLTFCSLYPEEMGTRVAGVVEVDTSYTNPVRTTKDSKLNLALQKPVGEPVLHAMVPLSEVFRAMNWVSYQEGLLYLNNARSSFDGTETRGQVDLVSRYQFLSSPGVVARGTLAMFHWDMTPELARIKVPVLMIVGKDDTTTLPSASETMAEKIAGGKLQVLNVGRHYSLLESNAAVNAGISEFSGGVLR